MLIICTITNYKLHFFYQQVFYVVLKTWSDYKPIKAASQKRACSLWCPANTDQQLAFSSHLASPSSCRNPWIPLKLGSVVLFPHWVILVKGLAVYTQWYYSKSRSKIVRTDCVQIFRWLPASFDWRLSYWASGSDGSTGSADNRNHKVHQANLLWAAQ